MSSPPFVSNIMSRDWITYLFQFMAGPEYYGFPFAKKSTGEWIFSQQQKKGWPVYSVPPPPDIRPHNSCPQTCLICFSQFLASGLTLEFIAAFNRKGKGWGTVKFLAGTRARIMRTPRARVMSFSGSLTVTTLENGDLLLLCAVLDAQRALRAELVAQEGAHGRDVIFTFPVHLISGNNRARRRDDVYYAFDPLNCPCGSACKDRRGHFKTAAHQAWLDQDDEDEDDDGAAVYGQAARDVLPSDWW
jgi:hypothetical protein